MALTVEHVIDKLKEKFGADITEVESSFGMTSFRSPKELNLKVMQFLYDDEDLQFRFMTDLTAVHYPDRVGAELDVVYHLHNMEANIRLRYKVSTSVADPKVYTASKLFESANWQERETYDFFGVQFVGHPNLKRILNVDEMDYFPLRKEFPLEDQTRTDKDDEMFGRGGSIGI
jgi:NADH-quinone oxidoreductase subunit C